MGAVIIPAMVIVVAIAGVIYFNCKDKKDIHKDSNSTKRSNVEVTHISRYGLILFFILKFFVPFLYFCRKFSTC